MVAIPRVFQRCARNDEALYLIAEPCQFLERLERIGALGCAHRDEEFVVYFSERGNLTRASFLFGDKP